MPDGRVLGMIAFADTEFDTIGYEAEKKTIELEEGTMLIDMSLIGTENRARKRFTEAHETSHWICHRSFHSPTNRQYDFRMNKNFIACRTENIESYRKNNKKGYASDEQWEEWQADSLAAALLMPKTTFSEAVRYAFHSYGNSKGYKYPFNEQLLIFAQRPDATACASLELWNEKIILCSDTDEDVAKYSVLHGNEQLFASKYKLYLPTEEELRAEIETQKAIFLLQQQENEADE